MAQLVEQLIRNQQVAGSSPASSSKKECCFFCNTLFCYYDGENRVRASVATPCRGSRFRETAKSEPVAPF